MGGFEILMKILLFIDNLGSGGAQRQIVNLAAGLRSREYSVEVLVYNSKIDFFSSNLKELGIEVHAIDKGRGFSIKVVKELIKLVKKNRYEAIISYLDAPNIYAEIASLFLPSTRLIVSERSSHVHDKVAVIGVLKRLLHAFADLVVANSYDHSKWLRKLFWLRNKVTCIYNGYPIPNLVPINPPEKAQDLKLIVVARIGREKNCLLLIEAMEKFYRKYGFVPSLSWVGRWDESAEGVQYRKLIEEKLSRNKSVQEKWFWLGEQSNVFELIGEHHAMIHASLYEGLPNVVCESLLSGRPVVASRVCDHPVLIAEGERGGLFDPSSSDELVMEIKKTVRFDEKTIGKICQLMPVNTH